MASQFGGLFNTSGFEDDQSLEICDSGGVEDDLRK
jgi:hypothetical protein